MNDGNHQIPVRGQNRDERQNATWWLDIIEMTNELNMDQFLPADGFAGSLIGRAWLPASITGSMGIWHNRANEKPL